MALSVCVFLSASNLTGVCVAISNPLPPEAAFLFGEALNMVNLDWKLSFNLNPTSLVEIDYKVISSTVESAPYSALSDICVPFSRMSFFWLFRAKLMAYSAS